MACDAVVFDQVYKILVAIRTDLRNNYDVGQGPTEEEAGFKLDETKKRAIRWDDEDPNWKYEDGVVGITVEWDCNNKDLRDIARRVMNELE